MAYKVPTANDKPGETAEVSDLPQAPAGVYQHANGQTAIIQTDPLLGDGQAQAFMRAGFEFVREADPSEISTLETASIDHANKVTANKADADDVKGLLARVNAIEAENSRLKAQIASGNPVPGTEAVPGAEQTKTDAQAKVAGPAPTDPATTGTNTPDTTKALSKMNATELAAVAETEGVDLSQADTNKLKVDAIQTARDQKASE